MSPLVVLALILAMAGLAITLCDLWLWRTLGVPGTISWKCYLLGKHYPWLPATVTLVIGFLTGVLVCHLFGIG